MTDLEKLWGDAVAAAAKSLWGIDLVDRHRPFVEPCHDTKFGDATSGLPMRLAKDLRKPPPVIAKELATALAKTPHAAKIESAAGYVNFTADIAAQGELVREIRSKPAEWGRGATKGLKVLVEHTSANPTGPMHIAHARQAAVGDSLANVLAAAGFDVAREFYINDTGGQIVNLAKSIFWRYAEIHGIAFTPETRGNDEEGKPITWLTARIGPRPFELLEKNAYRGDYIKSLAQELSEKMGRAMLDLPESVALDKFGSFGKERLLTEIKEDALKFRVRFDAWYSEEALRKSGKIESMLEFFRSWGLTYTEDSALFLKSKDFGDEKDRPLIKRDGEFVYRLPDLAYHRDKFDRGFDWVIDTWGPDHHAEIVNRTAGLKSLNFNLLPRADFLKATRGGTPEQRSRCFDVLIIQYCRLLRDGQEVKMGKRLASYVTMRELVEEVGVDAARWFLTMRKTDSPLDFDLDVAKKQTMDNPVYYAQYAHARVCSITKKGIEKKLVDASDVLDGVWGGKFDAASLGADEILLLRALRAWPRAIERAAEQLDPSLLTIYLSALSGSFQSYYQAGMKDATKRVIDDSVPEPVRRARLAVCAAVQITLRNGFKLLGITAPERLEREPE